MLFEMMSSHDWVPYYPCPECDSIEFVEVTELCEIVHGGEEVAKKRIKVDRETFTKSLVCRECGEILIMGF
jgi:predicted nucleic-acid-binding Zn-ribbon protein